MAKKSLKDLIKEKELNFSTQDKETVKELKKGMDKYKKMSNSQIVKELKKIKTNDKNGMLSQGKVNEFEKILSPMLNENQKKQLKAIKKQMGYE